MVSQQTDRPKPSPRMLRWAREQGGHTTERAAKAAGVKVEKLVAWEQGFVQPTWPQFRKLAHFYGFPTAAFYAAEPPPAPDPLADFRGKTTDGPSEALAEAIREANRDLETAKELVDFVPQDEEEWQELPRLSASEVRERLAVRVADQQAWESESEAFRRWSDAIQLLLGVLVYQFPGVKTEEARGFSLDGDPVQLIAVNSQDSYRGRVFSLFHELGHLILRQRALCDHSDGRKEEIKCNAFAGQLLVPEHELLAERVVRDHDDGDPEWSDSELRALANAYWVSEEVILRRLLDLELTTSEVYRAAHERYKQRRAAPRKPGFVPPDQLAIARHGALYVGMTLDAYHARAISGRDFYDLVGLNVKYVPQLAALLEKRGL